MACPIDIPTRSGVENRALGELGARAKQFIVVERDVEAAVARPALEEEGCHLPTSVASMVGEIGEGLVLGEDGRNLVDNMLDAKRIHRD